MKELGELSKELQHPKVHIFIFYSQYTYKGL